MLKHIAAASVAAVVVGYAVPSIADSKPVNTTADSAPTQPMNALPSTAAPAEAGKTPEMSKPGSATQVTPLGTQTVQNPTETPAPTTTTPASPGSTETAPASTPTTPSSTETAPATTPASPGSTETAPASTPTTIPAAPDATTPAPETTTPASPAPTTPAPATPAPATETPKPTSESSSTGARTMVLEKETITGVKEVSLPTPPVTPAYFTLPITLQVAKEAAITSDTPITDKLAKDLPSWGAAISACLRDKPAFVRVVGDEQVPFVVGEGEGKVRLNANNKPVCTASL